MGSMRNRFGRSLGLPILILSVLSRPTIAQSNPDKPVDYLSTVKPLLEHKCYACHGAMKQESGLRLDTAALAKKGGGGGPAVVPGKPEKSLMVERVTAKDESERMPHDGKPLTADEIALLKNWIAQGANASVDEPPQPDPQTHWANQPIKRPAIPAVKRADWVLNPIDAFIAAEHEKRGLAPVKLADKPTLLRRVYLDLIGLPPTRAELATFLIDPSTDAYEKVVDRLLKSPQYGERWGRHWMDVWRYSDWYGSRNIDEIRYSQRHIWRWRDWIVESLNADKGYDRMVTEMLAGDEVAPDDEGVLRATGYLGRNWYKFNRNVWLQETVEHTAVGFLAETMRCCRCHDHKFDPVSQLEYYRMRAFFEPHDFRIDPAPGETNPNKNGLSRVFDAEAAKPTYLFIRGDDRYPDTKKPLSPGTPEWIGKFDAKIEPVSLPPLAYYPALRPGNVASAIAQAQANVAGAQAAVAKARQEVASAQQALTDFVANQKQLSVGGTPAVFLTDNFSKARSDVWKAISGQWDYVGGRVAQKQLTSFATMMTLHDHPQDFRCRVRYKTTPGGTYRSVGMSFDMNTAGDYQAVYTSANDNQPTVQAFHSQKGQQAYPAAGIVPISLKVNQEIRLEFIVRGNHLDIFVDGVKKLDYTMPQPRQKGKFAIWAHDATAEFLELQISELVADKSTFERKLSDARSHVELAEANVELAEAEAASLTARLAAERARVARRSASDSNPDAERRTALGQAFQPVTNSVPPDARAKKLAQSAGKAEREVAIAKARVALVLATQKAALAKQAQGPTAKSSPALAEAEKQLATAQMALNVAKTAAAKTDIAYTPLGASFPATSTGRRTALARWIVDPRNPRTARVAVNHIWLRHFGQALVPSVSNFGMNGRPPSHPQLLDWLAAEFIARGWSMRSLHKLMVTSNAYQMESLTLAARPANPANRSVDPDNRYLWRMNSRRMDAEVVRDSVLHLAGQLDPTMGGPELDDSLGQTSRRRSMYFRLTPDNKMQMLELFDLANPIECYQRRESVIPQQALALANSAVALSQSRIVARQLVVQIAGGADDSFVTAAFEQVLGRPPTKDEIARCRKFLAEQSALLKESSKLTAYPPATGGEVTPSADPVLRAKENLILVLFNHNDFVTIH